MMVKVMVSFLHDKLKFVVSYTPLDYSRPSIADRDSVIVKLKLIFFFFLKTILIEIIKLTNQLNYFQFINSIHT